MPELFGISIEVYIIVPVLGIPVFFLWRWIFKKSRNETSTKIAIWIATIISTPIIYALLILLWFFFTSYYPNRDFNEKEWLANKDQRYEYSRYIIKSKMLIGKTKNDVRKILGDEGNLDSNDNWYYELGFTPEIGNIDPDELDIEFKNGKVVSVGQHHE